MVSRPGTGGRDESRRPGTSGRTNRRRHSHLFLQSEGSHTFTIGPGSFSWKNPLESRFTTAELYFGPDHYDEAGEPVEFSADEEKTITPGTPMADIAQEIAANFRRFNNHPIPARTDSGA